MGRAVKKEDLSVGDTLVMRLGGREIAIKVTGIGENEIFTSIGPVPVLNLCLLRRAEDKPDG